ncbi:MAG: HEPN domain-containing protein [Dehalococcoidia bacterium]
MICQRADISKQKLDNLYKRSSVLSADAEMLSHWSRYLCVLTSGFFEDAIRAIYSEYAERRSGSEISRYVQLQLNRFQNPRMGNILNLVQSFSLEWREEIVVHISEDAKDAMDSIVSNRHNIAHGRDVGLTMHTLQEYYFKAVKIVELIDQQCNQG